MSLSSSIKAILDAHAGLAALVPVERQFFGDVEQGTEMPYISWSRINSEPVASHTAKTTDEDCFHDVQFNIIAETPEQCDAIQEQLMDAIDHEPVYVNRLASFVGARDLSSEVTNTNARAVTFTI